MEDIRILLHNFGLQSSNTQNLLIENSTLKVFKKNENIFLENNINEFEYFLIEGVLHRYNLNELGENITTGLYLANDVITPHFARTVNSKSLFSLQTLTSARVIEIAVKELDRLRLSNNEFRLFGQKVLEKELSKNLFDDIVFRSLNAKDRLLTLRKTFPNIENLIPHSIIASFLGITNVSFSRLRNDLAK